MKLQKTVARIFDKVTTLLATIALFPFVILGVGIFWHHDHIHAPEAKASPRNP